MRSLRNVTCFVITKDDISGASGEREENVRNIREGTATLDLQEAKAVLTELAMEVR